ncbi:hypothetical protein OSB04_000793 [Centaurea solstitialis]|uniref:Uncharacterized protein n=1 Tax=Centaurea solstitialis TaxID=347529 RepID=A0AA38WKV7_9ASTR|nr:hypothetical protein OSB04_000793 [Centaurea solstitialis]
MLNINRVGVEEGETIRITVKNKPASGAGMLSAAGLSGTEKIKPLSLAPPPLASTKLRPAETEKLKPLSLAPPPNASGKIRSPIPPPPNDPAAARMTSTGHNVAAKTHKENARQSADAFTDLSQLEGPFTKFLPRKRLAATDSPSFTLLHNIFGHENGLLVSILNPVNAYRVSVVSHTYRVRLSVIALSLTGETFLPRLHLDQLKVKRLQPDGQHFESVCSSGRAFDIFSSTVFVDAE